MWLNAIILFLSVALPGLLLLRFGNFSLKRLRYFLIFAGSYLFSMTIIHIIPDLFETGQDPYYLSLWILLGFFLQRLLENFSSGVEHGHFHTSDHSFSVTYLLLALSLHSFLEGSIMTDAIHAGHQAEKIYLDGSSPKILLGIVMHKIPAALALMSLLMAQMASRNKALLLLMIFALASPMGLFLADYFSENALLPAESLQIFFAIVAGSFLQISTTIFIESDPKHHFKWNKFSIAVLGAIVAVAAQFLI